MQVCDVVTINAPLHPETENLFDEQLLAKMKRGAYLINTARGKICDRDAVARACESGQLAGYAGDVWFPQPAPRDHPWRTMPHHGMTPHTSGTSLSAQARYAAGTREILECCFDGRPIREEYLIVDGGALAGRGRALLQRGRRDRRLLLGDAGAASGGQPDGAKRGRVSARSHAASAIAAATSSTAGHAPIARASTCESDERGKPGAGERERRARVVALRPRAHAPQPAGEQHDAAERARAGADGDRVAGDQRAGGDRRRGRQTDWRRSAWPCAQPSAAHALLDSAHRLIPPSCA